MTTLNLASQRDLIKALLQFRPNQFRSRRGGGGGGGVTFIICAIHR